jgi:uncharacterized protein YlxP (DUF503 family)
MISKSLHGSIGEISGYSLGNGVGIGLSRDPAVRLMAMVANGAQLEVHPPVSPSLSEVTCADSGAVADSDSERSISVIVSSNTDLPEVPTGICAPPRRETPLDSTSRPGPDCQMIKQERNTVGRYVDEAKHTYQQAVSRYQAQDLERARDFAAASIGLFRLVEILISRIYHSKTECLSFVASLPDYASGTTDDAVAEHNLDRVAQLLAGIQWVSEDQTLPSKIGSKSRGSVPGARASARGPIVCLTSVRWRTRSSFRGQQTRPRTLPSIYAESGTSRRLRMYTKKSHSVDRRLPDITVKAAVVHPT